MITDKPRHASVLVVDLDGTLILGNSFHEFLRSAIRHGGASFRARIIYAALRRSISRSPHARWEMKARAIRAYSALSLPRQQVVVNDVLVSIRQTISEPIRCIVEDHLRSGVPVLLATAAPDFYARPFASALGLTACIATSADDVEMLGAAKAKAVKDWVDSTQGRDIAIDITTVTDHADDLPLMKLSTKVILQASVNEYESIARGLGEAPVKLSHVDPSAGQSGGGYWLWFDDRPTGPMDAWELRTVLSKHRYALGYMGNGRWARIRPGDQFAGLVPRRECPTPPTIWLRQSTLLKRRIVRDRLNIFH